MPIVRYPPFIDLYKTKRALMSPLFEKCAYCNSSTSGQLFCSRACRAKLLYAPQPSSEKHREKPKPKPKSTQRHSNDGSANSIFHFEIDPSSERSGAQMKTTATAKEARSRRGEPAHEDSRPSRSEELRQYAELFPEAKSWR